MIVVSNGPPRVSVPNVVGLMPGDARVRLQAVGLSLGRVSYDPLSMDSVGSIIAQSPAAGDSLRQGYDVRVTLAGADPNPPPPPVDSAAIDVPVDPADVDEEPDEEPDEPVDPEEPPPNEAQLTPRPPARSSPGGA